MILVNLLLFGTQCISAVGSDTLVVNSTHFPVPATESQSLLYADLVQFSIVYYIYVEIA